MRKHILVIVLLLFFTGAIYAQEGIKPAISVGPELNIPQRSAYNIGYGVSANFELPVTNTVSVVAGAGWHRYSYKKFLIGSNTATDPDAYYPLKAGVKYYADPRFYLQGELGTVLSNTNNSSGSNSNLFTYSLGTGFLIPLGESKNSMIDLGLRFEDWSQNRLQQFAIRVAYRFGF